MKYLILITVMLTLCGCETYPSGSHDSTTKVDSGKKLSYLNKPLRSRVSQRGLYRLVRSGGLVNDPNTSTGKAVSKPVIEMVKSTERIPLIKGAQMYMQYRIWYFPDIPAYVDLRRVLKHPPMNLPDGSVSTGSDYMIKGRVSVNQVIGFTGYGLDEDYELVEGDWVFEIWYKDKKLIEQKFATYRPDEKELAALKLKLKKEIVNRQQSPQKPFSKFNWPGKV
jgi:hypothetical protein